jgi:protein-tyrosine phosphatase
MSDDKTLQLGSVINFRDLGGYKTSDGRRVRRGLIFRSGDSSQLTEAERDTLRTLGIRLIVDLRSSKEAEMYPSRWPMHTDGELVLANIFVDLRAGDRSLLDNLVEYPGSKGSDLMMRESYRMLPQALVPVLGDFAKRLASANSTPAIVHCSVGRDRTGITCAVLLHALGVSREDIILDYLKTNEHIDHAILNKMNQDVLGAMKGIQLNAAALRILALARLENLNTAYQTMIDKFGSPDGYLRAAGIDDTTLARLREHLLEPA